MSLLDPTYAELERKVEELEDAITANDAYLQKVEVRNAELVKALENLLPCAASWLDELYGGLIEGEHPDITAAKAVIAKAKKPISWKRRG